MNDTIPSCPKCGADMVLRTARATGDQFYGCPRYPRCRGTRPLTVAPEAMSDPRDAADHPAAETAAPAPTPLEPGVAGASAEREYERRLAKREAAIDAKWSRLGNRIGGTLAAIEKRGGTIPQSTEAWKSGAAGERAVGKMLDGLDGVRALHDRRVSGTRGNIDHLVVAPAGVFVIDAKDHRGRIEVRETGSFLRPVSHLYVAGRRHSDLAHKMGWQIDVVQTALRGAGIDYAPTPVLCFTQASWPWLRRPREFAGVRLADPSSLAELLTRETVLDPEQVEHITGVLAAAFPSK